MFNTDPKHYVSSTFADEPLDPRSSHAMMVDMIGNGKRVLEFGCAGGYMSRYLRDAGNHVTGIELDAAAAEEARAFCDHVISVDLDMTPLDDLLPGAEFDVLAFGDVLEHLRDPWRVLNASRRLLAPDGYVVISIPNVAHGNVRLSLLRGSFDYEEMGLLDNTHLRFFTLRTVHELCLRAGFEIVDVNRTKIMLFGDSELVPRVYAKDFEAALIDEIRRDPEHDTLQFVVRAKPVSEGRQILIALKALAESEIKLADSSARAERLQSQLAGSADAAERYAEIEVFLAERIGEIERLRRELEGSKSAVERLRELETTVEEQHERIAEADRDRAEREASFAREEELTLLLADLRVEAEQSRVELEQSRAELEQIRSGADDVRESLRTDIERSASELERYAADLVEVEQRRALAEQALDELTLERSMLIAEVSSLRARVEEREAEIRSVRAETAEVRDAHATVTSALSELRYEYDVLQATGRALELERDAIVGRCAEVEAQSAERESAALATIAALRSGAGAFAEPRPDVAAVAAPRPYAVAALDSQLQSVSSVHRSTVDAFAGFLDAEIAMVRAEMAEIDAMIRVIQRSPAWVLKRAVGRLRLSMPGGRARV